jgi:diguanylate cyclase (GGDEF)-like protein
MTAAPRFDRHPGVDAALDDRVRYLIALRFLMAAIAIVFAFASPASLAMPAQTLVAASLAYVMAALAAVILGRRGDALSDLVTTGMLLVDGAFLALAVYGTGGSTSPLRFLLYLQLLAVSLLVSPRTGLAIAAWDSLLFALALAGQVTGLLAPVDVRPGQALDLQVLPVLNAVAFWVFAVSLAAFSALNERELRQRRADLETVVRVGVLIDDEGDPGRQASIVLDALVTRYALSRGLVLAATDTGLVVLGAAGVSAEPGTELGIDPLIARAWTEGRPIVHGRLDRATDPSLAALLRGGRRLIVAPMLADGRPVGAIVLERRYGQRPGLEQRVARVAAQLAAMTAVNLRNAVLLRRVRDVDERDPLTGVPSRQTFQASLQRAVWGGKRGTRTSAVLFIDLDDLAAVNEAHGFRVGDALLVAVARRIEALIRDGDVFARLGGDEFAILTQDDADLRRSRAMAERLVQELGVPFELDEGLTLSISASIGIAGADDAESAADLARNADIAMTIVKAGGRGGVAVFDPAMPREIRERRELASDLQQAVDLDQLELRYQPIVNLQTNTMAGVEALVRWRHPERGLVAPGQFIAIAEEHGSILPIGRWVLREACRQAAAWEAEGVTAPGMTVAVNVAAREVQEPGFVDGVREALRDHGVGPGTLVLEITEAAFLRATPSTVDTLQGLRDLGVRVVIDDFGTGYFPLSHLRRFPVDALKIASEFTREIDGEADARSSALAAAIIAMARSLGMDTVAEGIETEAQADWMRSLQCTYGQGYYFDRPMLPEDLPAVARTSVAALAEEAAEAEAVAEITRARSRRRRRAAEAKAAATPKPVALPEPAAVANRARRRTRSSGGPMPAKGAA